jgi:hypothetical protein
VTRERAREQQLLNSSDRILNRLATEMKRLPHSFTHGDMEGLGELLERFHVSSASRDLPSLADCLRELYLYHSHLYNLPQLTEREMAVALSPPPSELLLWKEIVLDCQKRFLQLSRSIYSDSVRTIITNYRKQLRSKAIFTATAGGGGNGNGSGSDPLSDPSGRYLFPLLELVGSWSNLIEDMRGHHWSSDLLALALHSFHSRVMEASLEAFEEFKNDKKLLSWTSRQWAGSADATAPLSGSGSRSTVATPPGSGNGSGSSGSGSGGGSDRLNLFALDAILAQLVSLREVIGRYQRYLIEDCPCDLLPSLETREASLANTTGTGTDTETNIDTACRLLLLLSSGERDGAAVVTRGDQQQTCFVALATDGDVMRWREAEGLYVALERLYLQHATQQALELSQWHRRRDSGSVLVPRQGESILIEVQPGVYALQVSLPPLLALSLTLSLSLSLCLSLSPPLSLSVSLSLTLSVSDSL